jgi:site-specific DNA recombinase
MKAHTPLETPKKRIGIWIRVSTDEQAKGESPEHHLERARLYAKSKEWTVIEVYDLAGQSGKSVADHPETKRMIADIKRGHISGLVFSKLARLSRNLREVQDFGDLFRKHNADLISLHESIDTTTPGGRMFFHLLGVFAQWEREEIADRVSASVTIRAKMGKPLSGVSPYGYRWKDKKLVLDPDEAPIRKLAYELFIQERRKGVVARLLNERGYRTRAGKKWSDIAVGRTLQDASAFGVYVFNRYRQTGSWTREEKPESEWARVQIEPIVSEEIWRQCDQILEEQSKREKRPGKKPVQLFAGFTNCVCGQRMYVKVGSPKYICGKCYNKIPIVDLEAVFYDEVKAFFLNTTNIAAQIEEANKSVNAKEERLALQTREIQKVRDEMNRTHRLYLDGQIPLEAFGTFYQPIEERLKQLQSELVPLQAEIDRVKVSKLTAEEVTAEAQTAYSRWPKLSNDEKRSIVEALLERIEIGKEEADGSKPINITLACPVIYKEMVNSQQELPRRSAPVRLPS